MLVGEVPPGVATYGLHWNALTQDGAPLSDLQTVPPEDLVAKAHGDSSIVLTWTPIQFTDYQGGYRVFLSEGSAGEFAFYSETSSKLDSSMEVVGLEPLVTHYFCIRTVTYPHEYNDNTVVSLPSAVVSATTGYLFADGFESGGTMHWNITIP